MNKPDIKRLKELVEKATPGPWEVTGAVIWVVGCDRDGEPEQVQIGGFDADDSAELVTILRNAAPDLLVAYETLQGIANANPAEWDEEVRDQFQEWAQSRARAAMGDKP